MRTVLKKNMPLHRPSQGDIFRDVTIALTGEVDIDAAGQLINIDGSRLDFTYCVVLSQECDLEQDYNCRQGVPSNQDKNLLAILVAPAYLAERLRTGVHLESLELKMQHISSEQWKQLKINKNERYHFVPACKDLNIPDLVIDFKHFYTVPRDYFYRSTLNNNYAASLVYLSRELMSQRFCNYLSRIGLPDNSDEINSHFSAMLSPLQAVGHSN